MMHIARAIEPVLQRLLNGQRASGVILTGIVGCGKTTAIESCLRQFKDTHAVFTFTGDDANFRTEVSKSTNHILSQVRTTTTRQALVFVDEVQKSEFVFDALKIAYDNGISFVVSGSNPQYLTSVARQRLQRRGEILFLLPLSLPEILQHAGKSYALAAAGLFISNLWEFSEPQLPQHALGVEITLTPDMKEIFAHYFDRGGLPLSHLATSRVESLRQTRMVVERGFEAMTVDTQNISDIIRIELARLNAQEFTYQGIFQKTGLRKRDQINLAINELIAHGYINSFSPMFPGENRRSYLRKYSFIDPGIVSYLTASQELDANDFGPRIEAMVGTRLTNILQEIPLKSQLGYFKPYYVDESNKTRFGVGEIDFIAQFGKRLIPIEVKSTRNIASIDTSLMQDFIKKHRVPYGIVVYGGVPYFEKAKKLLYWPFWLI